MNAAVNTLTGRPLFELLLALDGIEAPLLPLERTRDAFRRFLDLPAENRDGGACFQTDVVSEGSDGAVFQAGLFRQLTDPAPMIGDESATSTRMIGVWWRWDLLSAGGLRTQEIWAADCDSSTDFWARVEATAEWDFMLEHLADDAGIVSDEGGQYVRFRVD